MQLRFSSSLGMQWVMLGLEFLLSKPSAIMPKTNPKELHFPTWGEISKYGVNMLRAGDRVKTHFHDCNEFWIVVQGKGIAISGNVTYELGPRDMLITRAGDEHSMVVIESMIAVYFHGVTPSNGRPGYLYPGNDLPLVEWRRQKKECLAKSRKKVIPRVVL